jgi:hypothetical protein
MASAARPDASGIAQRFRGSVRRDVSSEPRVEPRAATAGLVHEQQSGLATASTRRPGAWPERRAEPRPPLVSAAL